MSMKNIREYDPAFLPRRYNTVEDAEKDQNAIYPYRIHEGKHQVNPDYANALFEEDFMFDAETMENLRLPKAR